MRIGFALYGSLDERSGGFRYDRKLVEGLRRAGDAVEVVELPWRAYPRGLLDNASPALRDRLRVDVDVMLQDELAHPSLLLANRDLPFPVVGVVHHLRASEPRRLSPLYRAVERRYLATLDGVACNSAATRDAVAALGVDPEATVVAPPAGDRFDPAIDDAAIGARAASLAGPDPGPLRVAFVGNVAPRKGLDTLVEGVARAEAAVELTVVGRAVDEGHVADVRRLVRERGLGERVRFAGRLSDADLADALRASHVLAVPSRYEGFGIVYLEGMSFGLPAVASRAGGADETVADGETGVLVDPDDPAAVARALDGFAADPERLAEMGRAARRRYERHPGWEETTARVRRLLAAVAGEPDAVEPEVAT
ncbi:glycosyltransferase family 4 protein [Halorubrum sp. 2020YC2]|uniref:glycosyltransferase family 4 protein n=1 Tax=Halorubrum sp. 2020YC2 TaxID=2836432 RepID=UPI001BE4E827|nr:glycosyltransferase family 4 protein [Halorubrum sp. 2020YC2]QWC19579.1 glycosyltransferase family 4 protein [Halorubrum sp. 2020YC2]